MTIRWRLTVEYDGAGFCGWQRQLEDITVQGVIETAIEKFSGERVTLHVAGRTDAGVHALGQIAHFDLDKPTTAEVVRDALNAYVRPHKVSIIQAEQVSSDFHARFDASQRTYRYRVINRRAPATIYANLAYYYISPLDEHAMQAAAAILIGTHDFSTFRAGNCQANSPIRTLEKFTVTRDGENIHFDITARSFLYHQVRNMVGTLCLVGKGHWSQADFKSAFEAADRTKGGPTAPAHGLYFVHVTYPALPKNPTPAQKGKEHEK